MPEIKGIIAFYRICLARDRVGDGKLSQQVFDLEKEGKGLRKLSHVH